MTFGTGNIVCAFCHFGVGTVVGDNNFLSAYNSYDHHNRLGSDIATGPACTTSGLVVLGDRIRLGTGIHVEPHVELGDDVQVASGSVIVASVPKGHAVKRRIVTTAVRAATLEETDAHEVPTSTRGDARADASVHSAERRVVLTRGEVPDRGAGNLS